VSADRNGPSGAGGAERRTSVRVTIFGDEYAIRSDASAAHTREVAEYVDRTIREVLSAGTIVETHKVAILAALKITDELFRLRTEERALTSAIEELSADVRRWLPPNKRGASEATE
jgi:cell division protein ZapA